MKTYKPERLKHALQQARQACLANFKPEDDIHPILIRYTKCIDSLLNEIAYQALINTSCCVIALGSYGRRELLPYSDIDIVFLYQHDEDKLAIEAMIRIMWDIGLEVGHHCMSITDIGPTAAHDVSIISNLMDHRFLHGCKSLYQQFIEAISTDNLWPSVRFFQAKWQEQLNRHQKFGGSAYSLEPNIKNGVGGLRDIQMILWIARRHFNSQQLSDLLENDYLTPQEYALLIACRSFLWKIRFALHKLAGKSEDRLLFDFQRQIAHEFGYQEDDPKTAIEKFMKKYYNVIKQLRELNEMILQHFRESILHDDQDVVIELNPYFQIRNQYIEIKEKKVFAKHPHCLFEIFLLMAQQKNIIGIRSETIRAIRQYKNQIDESFRNNRQNQKIFLQLLTTDAYHSLQLLNRYGLLGQYIPDFGLIIGQMQYDLFHIYTVDQHSLFVLRNLMGFSSEEALQTHPVAHQLFTHTKNKLPLYIGALFHDIAKGRGGDHSQLGETLVLQFCQTHSLSPEETELACFLVRYHLLMSQTAQRKDIYDPQTIQEFCQVIGSKTTLNYLYLLTVADISATNPQLWNSWKDSLLRELLRVSTEYFDSQDYTIDEPPSIPLQRKTQALSSLETLGFLPNQVKALWHHFKEHYFLYQPVKRIIEHTQAILTRPDSKAPLIALYPHHRLKGTEVFLYFPHQAERLYITTTIFHNFHLNILEARIMQCNDGYDLDSYIVLDKNQHPLTDKNLLESLTEKLTHALTLETKLPKLHSKRIARRYKYFNFMPRIELQTDPKRNKTQLFIDAADKPGLLANVAKVFLDCQIQLHNAKISTAGERVEDTFIITNKNNLPLDKQQRMSLKHALFNQLSS